MALELGDVAGLVVQAVEADRAAVDQGVGQHQPAGAVPVARMPEEGVAAQQDDEDPALGPRATAIASGLGSRPDDPGRRADPRPSPAPARPAARRGLDRQLVAVPGHGQIGRHHGHGQAGPERRGPGRRRRPASRVLSPSQPDRRDQARQHQRQPEDGAPVLGQVVPAGRVRLARARAARTGRSPGRRPPWPARHERRAGRCAGTSAAGLATRRGGGRRGTRKRCPGPMSATVPRGEPGSARRGGPS